MTIQILNQQKQLRLDLNAIRSLTTQLLERAAQRTATQWETLSLVITDHRGIEEPNLAYLGHEGPTDVVSLAFAPSPGDAGLHGEVIVDAQYAAQTRISKRWSATLELALYIAHGIDHITGGTDGTPEERRRMRRRELHWLRTPQLRELALKLIVEE